RQLRAIAHAHCNLRVAPRPRVYTSAPAAAVVPPCYIRRVPPSGGIPFGNYTLLRRLARGGMAEVFIARQKGLEGWGRRVAIKRILPHLVDSPEFTRMFLAEAKVAARLT